MRPTKKPQTLLCSGVWGLGDKRLAVSYSRMVDATLSLALSRFTSVFGMGTGGSNSLWPPGKAVSRAGAGHGRGGPVRCAGRHSGKGVCSRTARARSRGPGVPDGEGVC
jgi:hypothetical protein